MKIFNILLLCFLFGCSTSQNKLAQSKFESLAIQYLRDYKTDCVSEGMKTWGHSLCVPMIIVDREKMQAVTSDPDPDGKFEKTEDAYTGTHYGEPVYANTSIQWGGRSWSMVLWPLPEDRIARTHLMFHEAFHSVQNELGFPMNGAFNDHLDQEQARVLIRLEWNALLRALTDENQRKDHLLLALQLRNDRFSKFPDAKKNEEALEINEGLAEYTGAKLRGSSPADTIEYLNQRLRNVPKIVSLTRSSAYYSGPLYGLLLDTQEKNWKALFAKNRNFTKTCYRWCLFEER